MADIKKYRGWDNPNLAKVFGVDHSTFSKYCGINWLSVPVIPAGLIVPFYSGAGAPSGWTAFTAANGKLIVGASSGGVAVGETGGSNSVALSVSGCGNHGTNQAVPRGGGTGTSADYSPLVTGNHSHTATANLYPTERYFQLMKLNADATQFPAWMTLLGKQSFTGLTQYFNGEYRLIGANTTYGTTGSWTPANVYTSYAGTHHHVGNTGQYSTNVYDPVNKNVLVSAGNHRHLLTMSAWTNNIYRTRLTAWSLGSAFILQQGMIALWESFTPPAGWSLCDGTGGTPTMAGRFAELGTTSNHGTSYGTGQVTANWSNQNHPGHLHSQNQQLVTSTNFPHWSTQYHPNAHGTSQVKTFTPPYYGLVYIMYTG